MKKRSRGRIIRRILLSLFAGTGVVLLSAAFLLTRPFREQTWNPAQENPLSIYAGSDSHSATGAVPTDAIPVISPFHLQSDPMEQLLLINFEEDPDRIYVGFEPQFFDDAVHRRGLLVIGWRVDGRVDIFHEASLRLDPRTYGITGGGLNTMVERSFSPALFELGPQGVQTDIAFQDLEGRDVQLVIRETDTRQRTPFGLLAPMGVAATEPPALPLVYVDGFYFVRRAGTEYHIEIDGRSHEPDFIPLILDGAAVLSFRYSSEPFITMWNPDADAMVRTLEPIQETPSGDPVAYAGGVRYEVVQNGPFREIRRMSVREGDKEVAVEFSPAVPQLLALDVNAEVAGEFRITAGPNLGTVRGRWQVQRHSSEINIEVVPDGGWTPGPVPPMARVLFRAVSMFRQWPQTYVWRGTIQIPPFAVPADGSFPFQSGWERIVAQ